MADEFARLHLHRDAPSKPPIGTPCNGCGVCCALETCPVARLRFLQITGPCPALTWSPSEVRYHCGLLTHPARHLCGLPPRAEALTRHLLARWIAAGQGCDCNAEILPPESG